MNSYKYDLWHMKEVCMATFFMLALFMVSQLWIITDLNETDFDFLFLAKRRVALDW